MPTAAVRPNALDCDLHREHDSDQQQKPEIHLQLPHGEAGSRHAGEKQPENHHRDSTEDQSDLLPCRQQYRLAQRPHSVDHLLRAKPQDDHIDRHDQSDDDENNVERQDRDKNIIVQRLRTSKAFLALDRQNPELSKQVVGNEEAEHRDHPAQHQPMMGVGLALFRLNPSQDEQTGKKRRHELAQIRADRGMRPEKSGIFEPVHHTLTLYLSGPVPRRFSPAPWPRQTPLRSSIE